MTWLRVRYFLVGFVGTLVTIAYVAGAASLSMPVSWNEVATFALWAALLVAAFVATWPGDSA